MRYFHDLEDVKTDVDGAIIATPTHLHSSHGIDAAQRSWDVLIEKPVTATLQEATQLAEAVQRSGVASLVGHHRRYHHSVQHLKKMVGNGEIGTPHNGNNDLGDAQTKCVFRGELAYEIRQPCHDQSGA